jgi:hypothetical protein
MFLKVEFDNFEFLWPLKIAKNERRIQRSQSLEMFQFWPKFNLSVSCIKKLQIAVCFCFGAVVIGIKGNNKPKEIMN